MTTLKYSNSGTLLWTEKFANPYSSFKGYSAPASIRVDSLGYIYVAGTLEIYSGQYVMSLIKYHSNGTLIWYSIYHSPQYYDGAASLNISSGTAYVYGVTDSSKLTLARFNTNTGDVTKADTIGTNNGLLNTAVGMVRDAADNLYIAAVVPTPSNGNDVEVIAFDTSLNILWVDTIDGGYGSNDSAASITIDPNYNIAVTGYAGTGSGTQCWTFELNSPDGSMLWSAQAPNGNSQGNSLITDASANVYVTGKINTGGYNKQLTIAYNQSGNTIWQELYAPISTEIYEGHSITVDASGGVYVYGRQVSTTTTSYTTVKYSQWSPISCGYDTCPIITYAFENGHFDTIGVDTFVEFDIYAMQNEPSLPFTSGNVIFTYSNTIFGNNVVDSGNITVTRGTITADTNAYSLSLTDTLYKSDAVQSGGREVLLSISSTDTSHFAIADTFQQLCHVKMKMKHKGMLQINFDQFFMEDQSFYMGGDYMEYTYVNTGSHLALSAASNISLTYAIGNLRFSGTSQVTFDVVASSPDLVPVADAGIYLRFDYQVVSLDYGSIVTPAWMNDQYSSASTSSGDIYSVYALNNLDANPDDLYIQANYNSPYDPTDANVHKIPTATELFVSVTMNIIHCDQNPNIHFAFSDASRAVTNDYYDFSASNIANYNVTTSGDLTSPLCPTGINEIVAGKASFNVYPNPFSQNFTVNIAVSESTNINIEVTDMLGRSVYSLSLGRLSPGSYEQPINLPMLSSGIYFIRLRTDNAQSAIKIIKE